jgi:hypothetical protein
LDASATRANIDHATGEMPRVEALCAKRFRGVLAPLASARAIDDDRAPGLELARPGVDGAWIASRRQCIGIARERVGGVGMSRMLFGESGES